LEKPEGFFLPMFAKPLARGSVIYYPPQAPTTAEERFGVSPHSDYGCLTLLWQDIDRRARGPGQGRQLDCGAAAGRDLRHQYRRLAGRWTNDRFAFDRGTASSNRSGRERHSIALFYDPHFDTTIEVLDTCLAPGEAPRYQPTTCGAYIIGPARRRVQLPPEG